MNLGFTSGRVPPVFIVEEAGWAGHVDRMWDTVKAYNILVRKHIRKRPPEDRKRDMHG
jgi:hypothetical protein